MAPGVRHNPVFGSPGEEFPPLHPCPAPLPNPPQTTLQKEMCTGKEKTWELTGALASLVAQRLKCLPPMRETQVRSKGWKWQPTPVFLPGESHRQRSLVGYSPRGHKESDTTE